MPNGRVKWFDPGRGAGVVEHNGREYAVAADRMARDARTTGLPVHFDIERGPDGAGGSDIRRWLERSVLNGAHEARAEVEGDTEDAFVVRWRTVPGDDRVALESVLQVEDGAIVHQETRQTEQA